MTQDKTKSSANSIHNFAIGLVIGVTITAIVVSAQAFIGLGGFNRNLRYNIEKARDYFLQDTSDAYNGLIYESETHDTSEWQEYKNDNFKLSFKYPANWILSESKAVFCESTAQSEQECGLTLELKDKNNINRVITLSTDKVVSDVSKDLFTFPIVLNFNNGQAIFHQFRRGDCSQEVCDPDITGKLELTGHAFTHNGKGYQLVFTGKLDVELAAIINSFVLTK